MTTDPHDPAEEHWPLLPAAAPADPLARLVRFVADLSSLAADRALEESRIELRAKPA